MPTNVIVRCSSWRRKVLRCVKAPGDRVAKGDPIVEMTDKVTGAPRHAAYLHPTPAPNRPTRFGGLARAIEAARFLEQRDRPWSRDL